MPCGLEGEVSRPGTAVFLLSHANESPDMRPSRRSFLGQGLAASALLQARAQGGPLDADDDGSNVIVVTLDGLRWQEVFRGADTSLMNRTAGDQASADFIRKEFWRETPHERRGTLLPFFWSVVAEQGQLHGNRDAGSDARLTNGLKFSYPGYNEMFTGAPDPRVNSNDKIPNPNLNVFEWINRQPGFEGKVACFCSWDVFPYILNRERSGLTIMAGWEPYPALDHLDERERTINELIAGCHREWDNNIYDAFTFEAALTYLARRKPRVLYIGVGETDEHSHHDRYDFYLRAAQRADRQIERLWKLAQSLPEYRGKTSILVTTDHGRGEGDQWRHHGEKIKDAEHIWLGILGPHTDPIQTGGPWPRITQSQVAATVASLLGLDFAASRLGLAPPIEGARRRG
jgi:hypothetical protein